MGTEGRDGTPSEYAQLAAEHGLTRQVGRPPFLKYLSDLWKSHNFIWTLATTRAYARNENTYLGQIWTVLNPLLYAVVYYVIFGEILGTSKGITNFVAFLVIGIFVYQFCAGALSRGANAIVANTGMIRSLRFPRAALPISVVITEFLMLLPAIAVMLVIVTLDGETPSLQWLLIVPGFLLIAIFNAGVALISARIVSHSRDAKNLIPFVTQLLRYMSGVFFSISAVVGSGLGGTLLMYQPYALAIDLIRGPLMEQFALTWLQVGVMAAWSFGTLVAGVIYFWRGEGKYGVE